MPYIVTYMTYSAKMAHHRQYSLQERLGNFIVKEEASQSNVERLHNFLKDIEPIKRKKIINAHLTPYYNRTSVHLAAEKGLAPFLHVLLKHGGEILMTNIHLCMLLVYNSSYNYYISNSSQRLSGELTFKCGMLFCG